MITRPLRLACPTCGGLDIVYSCEPRCCFNHVCAACRTTFQTATTYLGEKLRDLEPPQPAPESTEPSAPCCECREVAVCTLADGRRACSECGALLAVHYEDIAPA